jgi:hypothetical protein
LSDFYKMEVTCFNITLFGFIVCSEWLKKERKQILPFVMFFSHKFRVLLVMYFSVCVVRTCQCPEYAVHNHKRCLNWLSFTWRHAFQEQQIEPLMETSWPGMMFAAAISSYLHVQSIWQDGCHQTSLHSLYKMRRYTFVLKPPAFVHI